MNKKTFLKKILFVILTSSHLLQSSFVYSASPKAITKELAKHIEIIINNVNVKYETLNDGNFSYLSTLSFGVKKDLLKKAVKKLPTTKPVKGMKLNKYSLSKVFTKKNHLGIDIWAKGKYAPNSYFDVKVAFKIRFYLNINQSKKIIRIYKYTIEKTKIGGGLSIPTKSLSKSILKSYAKEKTIDASSLFDKMSAYQVSWQGFSIENGYIYFTAKAKKPFKISKNIEAAFELLKQGKIEKSLLLYKEGFEEEKK